MKDYAGVLIVALIVAFFLGMTYIGNLSSESKINNEIRCIQAGGKIQSLPYACINKDQ